MDGGKLPITGGLHPQGQPVHPRPPQKEQHLPVHAVGVGLYRNLHVPRHQEPPAHRRQQLGEPLGAVPAGRAAAEVDRIHLIPLGEGGGLLDVCEQGLLVLVHPVLPSRQGVEVAVIALAAAEGNVDVNTKLFGHKGSPDFYKESLN